uniref:Transposase (Putative), gypsy type n=1 Tax=Tanacetum cinerariifolium TaxID=118510 RepID=A0A6L2LCF2_TANCI|nr:hypothetical protein [Tanacetum cinerariifolium]
MDLLSFIRTVDPTKVRVAKRQRVENEPRLLESAVKRVVLLLPIAPSYASSELEASVDKLFDEGASGDGQGTDIQPVVATTDTIVEDVASLQPRRQRKRKIVVADASGPSHPPKKLREDYRALSGASTADKSRSSALAIATVTIMTAAVDADVTVDRVPVVPSLFGVGSSSTAMTDSVPRSFLDVSGSDFLIGGIRTVVDPNFNLQKMNLPPNFFAFVREMDHDQLFTEFNVGAARQISLSAELLKEAEAIEAIRLRAEVFKFKATEKSLQGEVGVLRDHSTTLEREKNELSVKVTDLSALVKVREQEVDDLDAQVTAIKLQNDNLVDQVHELEIYSVGLQEKVAAYEDFIGQLEKFQDKKIEEVNEKFDKLCADFVDMALHLEEKFYSHLLTTISRRRWLLTYVMELAVVKCLNSTEYLSALGAAISKAIDKGMQEGLSAGITHGTEDASVDTIMNLLHLDDALAERLGLTESQPHANQLMVPIHHFLDQRVVGAFALSLSLDVSHSRVRKIRENIASHVSALRGVFVPLSELLSAATLKGTKGTSGSTHDTTTTLSVTFVFASTIPPISTDNYEVAHADGQGVPVWMTKPQLLATLIFFLMLAMQS